MEEIAVSIGKVQAAVEAIQEECHARQFTDSEIAMAVAWLGLVYERCGLSVSQATLDAMEEDIEREIILCSCGPDNAGGSILDLPWDVIRGLTP